MDVKEVNALHRKYRNHLEIHENDDKIVQILAADLNLSEGWDFIPEDYHSAGVLSYRGDDIWYFRHSYIDEEEKETDGDVLNSGSTEEYVAIKFPGAVNNLEMEAYAHMFVYFDNMRPRYIGINNNNKTLADLNFN